MLDIAVFLVIFMIALQDSSIVLLCPGLRGRILMALTAFPDSSFFLLLSVVCHETIPPPLFFWSEILPSSDRH